MDRRNFIKTTSLAGIGVGVAGTNLSANSHIPFTSPPTGKTRKLFIYGGNYHEVFNRYVAALTGKEMAKVCFVGTASGDSDRYINGWLKTCENAPVKPYVQRGFINSNRQTESFEEVFMEMDAIIVGGGNTLNMLAVWAAQGMDKALKKAYENGVILAGGSAGSMCWFQDTITDSRPKELTQLECLGWMKGSHIPHYDTEGKRKPMYHKLLLAGQMQPGYACDEMAGVYFENEKMKEAVSAEEGSNSYWVSLKNGKVDEQVLSAKSIR